MPVEVSRVSVNYIELYNGYGKCSLLIGWQLSIKIIYNYILNIALINSLTMLFFVYLNILHCIIAYIAQYIKWDPQKVVGGTFCSKARVQTLSQRSRCRITFALIMQRYATSEGYIAS